MRPAARFRPLCTTLAVLALVCACARAAEVDPYQRGLVLKDKGDLPAAATALRKALSLHPDDYRAALQLGQVYLHLQHPLEAAYWLDMALQHNPGWDKAERLLAEARAAAGDTTRPVAAPGPGFPAPIPSRTPEIEKLFKVAVEQYDKRDYQQALLTIRKVLAAQPDHPGAFYYGGLIRRNWGENDLAAVNFVRAFAYADMGYNAHFYLAKIYVEGGKCDSALPHLKSYIARTTLDAGAREARRLMERCGAVAGPAAEPDTSRASSARVAVDSSLMWVAPAGWDVLLKPVHVDTGASALAATGLRLLRAANYAEAVSALDAAVANPCADSTRSALRYDAALCRLLLGRFGAAAEGFGRAAARADTSVAPRGLVLRAFALREAGAMHECEVAVRDYCAAWPQHAWAGKAQELLGDACLAQGTSEKAIEAYERAVSAASGAVDAALARHKLGETLAAAGLAERALVVFQAVLDVGEREGTLTRVPDASYRVADLYVRLGRESEALECYARSVSRYPRYHETPWGLYQLAALRRLGGDRAGSNEACTRLRREYPEDYWARQADTCTGGSN